MGILHTLGLEDRKIISQGRETAGTVTRVKTCWWIKVNTKHVRMGSLDGEIGRASCRERVSA